MTTLDHYILDAVRIGLSACVAGRKRKRKHPDSSRQRKTRQRDVTRYEARRMKVQQPTYLPKLPVTMTVHPYVFMTRDFGQAEYDGVNHTLMSINGTTKMYARQEPWRSSYVRARTSCEIFS